MTWRVVGRLTHLSAPAQRRLWRVIIALWSFALFALWVGLSTFTRFAEKAYEEAGQAYVAVAPLAAEVMDLRDRRGQYEALSPIAAAEHVARNAGIGPERLRLVPGADPGGRQNLRLHASRLTLRELVDLLRDLRLQCGLLTASAGLYPSPGDAKRADLDLELER